MNARLSYPQKALPLTNSYINSKKMALPLLVLVLLLAGCSGGRSTATRTPVPTWTPTPANGAPSVPAEQAQSSEQVASSLAVAAAPAENPPADNAGAEPAAPAPANQEASTAPQAAPTPVPVDEPAATPNPEPTEIPTEVPTEVPTETPTPVGPQYEFELESAEKFPTDSLAENVVRVFLYVYGGGRFALSGYSLVVAHDESSLPVDSTSTGGLPDVTRDEPGKFTRFTNMNAIFIEPQGGTWAIQLVDGLGVAVGPPAFLELDPDDDARELYVRYRLK